MHKHSGVCVYLGIVISFLQTELTGRRSRIFPIKLIVFYIIGSGFRADFLVFSHVCNYGHTSFVSVLALLPVSQIRLLYIVVLCPQKWS